MGDSVLAVLARQVERGLIVARSRVGTTLDRAQLRLRAIEAAHDPSARAWVESVRREGSTTVAEDWQDPGEFVERWRTRTA